MRCVSKREAKRADLPCASQAPCDRRALVAPPGTVLCPIQAPRPHSHLFDHCRSQPIQEAAEERCEISCAPVAECAVDDDCEGETNDCVVQADGLWAQCIDCGMNQTDFSSECVNWSKDIQDAAEARCEMSCAPPAQCATDDDCDGDLECAVQENGLWAQCVPCDEETFTSECVYWSDDIIVAAEAKCEQTCNKTAAV